MKQSPKDLFDVIAERIVSSHSVSKNVQSSLTRHIASELRQADHRARNDLRRDLRALLDVPSTEEVSEACAHPIEYIEDTELFKAS